MARRVILHADLNCFYASVEINENPAIAGKPVAVCGSTENRHGIVLAKSEPAKACGIKTGMTNWQAQQLCPDLICLPPRFDLYLRYSRLVRRIYARYSNDIEPFGMDENWMLIDGCRDFAMGESIADEIRRTVQAETGLTISIGVSFNKIFAKLGSDMKKPNAVTVIDPDNFREKIWPLPVSELLYVGPATTRKLKMINVHTIGDLARCSPEVLRSKLGKNGLMLWRFANGLDYSPVLPKDFVVPVQSVGHGTTCVADLEVNYDVWRVMYELAQDVGHRLHKNRLIAGGVQVSVRDDALAWRQYQAPLNFPTRSPLELAQAGYGLFAAQYGWSRPVRAVSIRGINLESDQTPVQLDFFNDRTRHERRQTLDDAVDEIRRRFGVRSICAASLMGDLKMAQDKYDMVVLPGMMHR